MDAIDITNQLVKSLLAVPAGDTKRTAEGPQPNLHPQAAVMFIYMARHATHHIDQGSANYDDYTVPVTGLALTNCLVGCEQSPVTPSFEPPRQPDKWVKAAFARQLMAELNREQAARLQQGIWACWYSPKTDLGQIRLARRRRQSALTLLDNIAQPSLLRRLLGPAGITLSDDQLYYALAASSEILHFATHADPAGWATFETRIGIDSRAMAALASFLVFLDFAANTAQHSFWYDEQFLVRLWEIHVEAWTQYRDIPAATIMAAVRSFSMPPSEAATLLIHPPFYFLHGRFLRNPCFLGAHNPIANLLIIAIRRHEQSWSETLGTTLAQAADVVVSLLPTFPHLKAVSCRKYPGGDVDLALYDTQSRELLLCEVKTVYDKHRTDSLSRRFEEAKVNIAKAVSQLRASNKAISAGSLTLKHLFGLGEPPPIRVHLAVLTWLDPIDLTMQTADEDILSLNFATFLWLAQQSGGNVQLLAAAIHELRNLWAISTNRPLDLGHPELKVELEVQRGLLDARDKLAELPLSPLTRQIVRQFPSIDDLPPGQIDSPTISYFEDTRQVLKVPSS